MSTRPASFIWRLVAGLALVSIGFGGFTFALFRVAHNASVENCETSNEDRELLLVFLRRELTPSDDPGPSPQLFTVPPDADSALASFITEQVNPFLDQIGVTGMDEDEMEEAETILDRAERLFRSQDC